MLFIDDFTRMTWVYFLKGKEKEEYAAAFLAFKAEVEKVLGFKIEQFRCDNGKGEYNN